MCVIGYNLMGDVSINGSIYFSFQNVAVAGSGV